MWIVKYVVFDEVYQYTPIALVFSDYESARIFKDEKEELLESQINQLEELYEDKIISEIFIEKIEIR
jgi:hypothetical protein